MPRQQRLRQVPHTLVGGAERAPKCQGETLSATNCTACVNTPREGSTPVGCWQTQCATCSRYTRWGHNCIIKASDCQAAPLPPRIHAPNDTACSFPAKLELAMDPREDHSLWAVGRFRAYFCVDVGPSGAEAPWLPAVAWNYPFANDSHPVMNNKSGCFEAVRWWASV